MLNGGDADGALLRAVLHACASQRHGAGDGAAEPRHAAAVAPPPAPRPAARGPLQGLGARQVSAEEGEATRRALQVSDAPVTSERREEHAGLFSAKS